ncbi:Cupin domain-containing protein [Streptomyces sp. DvalAA-14]|uniref:cupin domain-containing protein n=1 Tax=unclassified Streptomyces TaxID=2593676 RepID=UPI00081B75EC|nr:MULTISPECIES: cupin domain-containing protein [unclassified Streptomyces]MYS21793.1 cupin domain-containing protein [Streptomyces sp. SID4948]SCE01333.1 Cupin domain-containing protein [Streptomyces sp. DvalAA-14]
MSEMDVPPVAITEPGQGTEVEIPGFGAQYKLWSRDTGGLLSVVEHPFAVGIITAPHRHTHEDEHSLVLEGEIGFRSDDSEKVLGPGGYIRKPRGEMHAMWNAGDVPGRIVEIIAPGGFETYFRDLSELMASGNAQPSDFSTLSDKYGITYGRPDWLDDVVQRYGLNPPTH